MHDLRVLLRVRRRRRDLHELHDVLRGGLLVVDAALAHLVQHRIAEHFVDRLEDIAVGLEIEILRAHRADHVVDAAAVDQDRAEHRLLGL